MRVYATVDPTDPAPITAMLDDRIASKLVMVDGWAGVQ